MTDEIKRATKVLKSGGIIAYPTDTLFGLGCDATNEQAVNKLIRLKKREKKPMSIACSNIEMMEKYAEINKIEKKILEKYLPGPFTFIFPKKESIPDIVTAESSKVGVRIPDYPKLIDIIESFGRPIISTSANIAGEPDIENLKDLELPVDYLLDGECKHKQGSTVVDLRERKILREGVCAEEMKELLRNI